MSTQQWVNIDPTEPVRDGEPLEEGVGPFGIGARVIVEHGMRNQGRTGEIVSWGRAIEAHEHWTSQHGTPVTCDYGSDCDVLCDNEGPVVRFDDQDPGDESLTWFCGQGMSALEPAV